MFLRPKKINAIWRNGTIDVEKRIKAGNRKSKEQLINDQNPEWKDLWEQINEW